MSSMKVVQVPRPGADFEIVEPVGGEFQIALILGSLWRDSIYPITKM
jgi:hypothetical protein